MHQGNRDNAALDRLACGIRWQRRLPWYPVGLCAAIAIGLVIGQAVFAPADEGPNGEPHPGELRVPQLAHRGEKPKKWNAEALRKKFPFESLEKRLANEARHQSGQQDTVSNRATLSAAATASVDTLEDFIESQRRYDARLRALAELHSDRVEQFISQEGFGLSRLPRPTPYHLELPESPPIGFASVSSDAQRYAGSRPLAIPATLSERGEAPSRLPSLTMLRTLNETSRFDFLSVARWGLVKDKEHVSGFVGHAFSAVPRLVEPRTQKDDPRPAEPDPKHPWRTTRLELVSLLMHDTPRVYVTERLPKMSELAGAKSRDLTEFEQRALKSLKRGDEVATEATLNRISMLGSVRATKQCVECHSVQRGELLGAFSYELVRDPPVKPVSKPAT